MLRCRDIRGREVPLPAAVTSIEICSTDGKVGKLMLLARDSVVILDADDKEFHDYCRIMKVEKAELVELQ